MKYRTTATTTTAATTMMSAPEEPAGGGANRVLRVLSSALTTTVGDRGSGAVGMSALGRSGDSSIPTCPAGPPAPGCGPTGFFATPLVGATCAPAGSCPEECARYRPEVSSRS